MMINARRKFSLILSFSPSIFLLTIQMYGYVLFMNVATCLAPKSTLNVRDLSDQDLGQMHSL
jgi:hypothetical protein